MSVPSTQCSSVFLFDPDRKNVFNQLDTALPTPPTSLCPSLATLQMDCGVHI
uniref:Uncharacterized protein n=1 Tax=Anguilla anguilla TaxID=7936 RepID=A0A0E9RGM6_ANGAN